MKRVVVLSVVALLFGGNFLSADMVNGSNVGDSHTQVISLPKQNRGMKEIQVRVEPISDEQVKNGITQESIKNLVLTQLAENDVPVSSTVQQPILVLRVRSIMSGLDIATYFQLSLMEESMLIRNRSTFNAITWSQASLLTCRPEEFQNEVVQSVNAMVQAFTKDYKKAFGITAPATAAQQ